ncbi:hypothetical protein G3N59_24270 [Paraburkholderia sp. Ac-20340]|uniref:hypothetical protein n=1 Tax=Paraburkholderia sp. Ac-20340 TaxID=2703888 RepID=UPI00197EE935|nr:hypothetical protein [Paraburkholderia sp. Ac-20340]MBN3856501.1 hypothetical protein [Paraburkholderia sp. Ac-20340]
MNCKGTLKNGNAKDRDQQVNAFGGRNALSYAARLLRNPQLEFADFGIYPAGALA